MALKIFAAGLFVLTVACNNEAADNGKDSTATPYDSVDQHGLPQARDIMGGDTIPSPETQADSSHTILKK